MSDAVLEVEGLVKAFSYERDLFGRSKGLVRAVDDVSISLHRGETLGIVGESGAGKSTLGRLVLRLIEPDAGRITFHGVDLMGMGARDLRRERARMRMIFQDPFSSLGPRRSVGSAVEEVVGVHLGLRGAARRQRVLELFERVGLGAHHIDRRAQEFSGGQLQRVAIARAIVTEPDLVVCDEAVAALDVSVRAQVINLLQDLQEERGIAYLFITHDLALLRLIAHRVAVMYRGRIIEHGPTESVLAAPRHPYTRALLEAIPVPDPDGRAQRRVPARLVQDPRSAPDAAGCPYAPRCPEAMDLCWTHAPDPHPAHGMGYVACRLEAPRPGDGALPLGDRP